MASYESIDTAMRFSQQHLLCRSQRMDLDSAGAGSIFERACLGESARLGGAWEQQRLCLLRAGGWRRELACLLTLGACRHRARVCVQVMVVPIGWGHHTYNLAASVGLAKELHVDPIIAGPYNQRPAPGRSRKMEHKQRRSSVKKKGKTRKAPLKY